MTRIPLTRMIDPGPSRGARRAGRHRRLGTVAALSLALTAVFSAGAQAASTTVHFSPVRTYPGGAVRVSLSTVAAKARGLGVYLGAHRTARRHDLRAGTLHGAAGTVHVPVRTAPGRYYVFACQGRGERRCVVSSRRLRVLQHQTPPSTGGQGGSGSGGTGGSGGSGGTGGTGGGGSGPGNGDYKYIVKYSHTDEASYTRQQNSTMFIGTDTFHQQFGLDSDIELKGDAVSGTADGSGTIDYSQAAYHSEQDGSFGGQGGVAGSPGACDGSAKLDLTSTTSGSATVVGLHITQTQITLDFRPGQFGTSPGGPPNETYHWLDTLSPCPGADSTETEAIFLNTFENFYYLRESTDPNVRLIGQGTSNEYVHLTGGWQPGGADQPNVVATLTITGSWNPGDPNSTYTDHYEIDRLPDQG